MVRFLISGLACQRLTRVLKDYGLGSFECVLPVHATASLNCSAEKDWYESERSTAIGVINGLMSLPLVWFLMRVIEKRSFEWKDVGLDWRRNSLLCLAFGAFLALLIYVAGTVVDRVLGSSIPTINTVLAGLTVSAVVRNLALWIPLPGRYPSQGQETIGRYTNIVTDSMQFLSGLEFTLRQKTTL